MRNRIYLLLPLLFPFPACAQGLLEFGDLRGAGAAGTGAGLSASMGLGKAVQKSVGKAAKAQSALFQQQTQAINQYWASGCQYEAAKQWANAEKTFAYVLQIVTMRDGAKSATRVPVLKKLVTATKAEKKIEQAIQYQKSILDVTKGQSRPDERAIVSSERDLSSLYLEKKDYASAEPVLRDSVSMYEKYPSLPNGDRVTTIKTYSTVLRKLKKNAEADKVEKSLLAPPKAQAPAIAPSASTSVQAPAATPPVATPPVATPPVAAPTTVTEPITPEESPSKPTTEAPAQPTSQPAIPETVAQPPVTPASESLPPEPEIEPHSVSPPSEPSMVSPTLSSPPAAPEAPVSSPVPAPSQSAPAAEASVESPLPPQNTLPPADSPKP